MLPVIEETAVLNQALMLPVTCKKLLTEDGDSLNPEPLTLRHTHRDYALLFSIYSL